jgi:electron transfer flavoprotein alpha subunit
MRKGMSFSAITMEGKKAVINSSCTECIACLDVCPFGAIEKVDNGITIMDCILIYVSAKTL